jgi:hypothetical protein
MDPDAGDGGQRARDAQQREGLLSSQPTDYFEASSIFYSMYDGSVGRRTPSPLSHLGSRLHRGISATPNISNTTITMSPLLGNGHSSGHNNNNSNGNSNNESGDDTNNNHTLNPIALRAHTKSPLARSDTLSPLSSEHSMQASFRSVGFNTHLDATDRPSQNGKNPFSKRTWPTNYPSNIKRTWSVSNISILV